MVKVVFLDRDGVINRLVSNRPPWKIEEFEYNERVFESVSLLKSMNFQIHVITNQPDVDDGFMNEDELNKIHNKISKDLEVNSIQVARKRNDLRKYKPGNGMLLNVIDKLSDIDLLRCWMVGDSWKDIVAGFSTKIKTIYIGNNWEPVIDYPSVHPDFMSEDLWSASQTIKLYENLEINK